MSDWRPLAETELLEHAPSLADCWEELGTKLPDDRRWFSGLLPEESIGGLLHTPCEAFNTLSGGSGCLHDTAELLAGDALPDGEAQEPARWIRELAASFDPERLGTLALGANDLEAGPWMLLDGNHRATALLLRRRREPSAAHVAVPVVLALSARPLNPW